MVTSVCQSENQHVREQARRKVQLFSEKRQQQNEEQKATKMCGHSSANLSTHGERGREEGKQNKKKNVMPALAAITHEARRLPPHETELDGYADVPA